MELRPGRHPTGPTGITSRQPTMKVLVTGGAGYIGSHAVRELADAGFHPVSFDNLSEGHREAVLTGSIPV